MAKLHFRYGAMNAGKTTIIIQTAHNYEERDQHVLILKSAIDTKGDKTIVTRIGLSREVDYLVKLDDNIIDLIGDRLKETNCILVDEAQFLTRQQVNDLFCITKIYDVPVIAFGIRTDFRTNGFEGSVRLLELADAIEEIPTICRCGKKARFNSRKVNGEFTRDGESVVIDGTSNVEYESLCGTCYAKKVLKMEEAH